MKNKDISWLDMGAFLTIPFHVQAKSIPKLERHLKFTTLFGLPSLRLGLLRSYTWYRAPHGAGSLSSFLGPDSNGC